MERYFRKKRTFGVMFVILLFGFSIANIVYKGEAMKKGLDIEQEILGRHHFKEVLGGINFLMGKNANMAFSHIKDKKGYLHDADFWHQVEPDIKELVNRVVKLRRDVVGNGSKVVVLMAPSKNMEGITEKFMGLPYRDRNYVADEFLKSLEKKGIFTVDFRDSLQQSHLSYEEIFYKTEYLWTTKAAFDSFDELVEQMNAFYGLQLDPTYFFRNIKNYTIETYPDTMLGSQGKRAGAVYSGLDDFSTIYPAFKTDYIWTYDRDEKSGIRDGRFEEALMISKDSIDESIYEADKYQTYLFGLSNFDHIVNTQNKNGLRVLFVRDAFATPLAAFFSSVCSEVDLIGFQNNGVQLQETLEKNRYDYIFVSVNPDHLNERSFLVE